MMADVVPCSLTGAPWEELTRATAAAAQETEPEAAIREIVHCALRITGDATAYERPGALKTGERNFHVAGVFMVSPDDTSHLLSGAFLLNSIACIFLSILAIPVGSGKTTQL